MLHCASVEQHEIEYFCPLADIFFPLCKAASCRLSLRAQILEQAEKPPILNVGGLCFDETFYFFEIVVDFMRLLHIVLVGCLKYTPFALLVVEKPEFDLNVHWVFELLDALLHRAKIACKVVFRLFLDEREYDGQLIEEVLRAHIILKS